MRLTLALLALWASNAPAHALAELERAEPRVGRTVTTAPREVTLEFSDDLVADGTSGEVRDASGERVDAGRLQIDPAEPRRARIPLKRIGPGEYVVRWWAKTDDGDETQGRFRFVVSRQGRPALHPAP